MLQNIVAKLRRILSKRSALFLTLYFALGAFSFGQISIGPQIVFDPTVVAKIGSQILQGAKVLATTIAAYEQIKLDAMFVTNKNIWRGAIVSAVSSALNSNSPVTAPWAVAITRGANAAVGYSRASVTLETNPKMIVVGDVRAPFYASAQIGTASNTQALQAIGNANTFTTQMAPAIDNCETSTLSTDPTLNTHAALQNISNACAVLALRQQQAMMQLETARTGVELAQAKVQNDTLIEHLNTYTDMDTSLTDRPSSLVGMTDTLSTYMPH